MYVNNPFNQTIGERWEREELAAEAHAEFFDAEFPDWRESESDPERFVSEFDYFAPTLSTWDNLYLYGRA